MNSSDGRMCVTVIISSHGNTHVRYKLLDISVAGLQLHFARLHTNFHEQLTTTWAGLNFNWFKAELFWHFITVNNVSTA